MFIIFNRAKNFYITPIIYNYNWLTILYLVYDKKKFAAVKTVLCLPLPSSPAQNKLPNYDILALHFRKINFYSLFSHRINAASITCCRREVDEVKKKWKDARTNVKKKEAMRKKQSTTTGGGPPPEVYFKPWELDV